MCVCVGPTCAGACMCVKVCIYLVVCLCCENHLHTRQCLITLAVYRPVVWCFCPVYGTSDGSIRNY